MPNNEPEYPKILAVWGHYRISVSEKSDGTFAYNNGTRVQHFFRRLWRG